MKSSSQTRGDYATSFWGPFLGPEARVVAPHAVGRGTQPGSAVLLPGTVVEAAWRGNVVEGGALSTVQGGRGEGGALRLGGDPSRKGRGDGGGAGQVLDWGASDDGGASRASRRVYATSSEPACVTDHIRSAALHPPGKTVTLGEFAGRFSFARDTTFRLINYNKELTDDLLELQAIFECKLVPTTDDFRARTCKRVIETVKRLPFCVREFPYFETWYRTLSEDQRKFTGIGGKWLEKIELFCRFGYLQDLESRRRAEKARSARDLVRLFGVGPVKALRLVEDGVDSIAELKRRVDAGTVPTLRGRPMLESDSLKCLSIVDDLELRIPRAEVEEILATVRAAAEQVYAPLKVEVTVCGSYRRGKDSCGDVDMIITTPQPVTRGQVRGGAHGKDSPLPGVLSLRPLIQKLHEDAFITHHLRWADTEGGKDMFIRSTNPSAEGQQKALKAVMEQTAVVAEEDMPGVWAAYRKASFDDTIKRLRAGKFGYDLPPGYARRTGGGGAEEGSKSETSSSTTTTTTATSWSRWTSTGTRTTTSTSSCSASATNFGSTFNSNRLFSFK